MDKPDWFPKLGSFAIFLYLKFIKNGMFLLDRLYMKEENHQMFSNKLCLSWVIRIRPMARELNRSYRQMK